MTITPEAIVRLARKADFDCCAIKADWSGYFVNVTIPELTRLITLVRDEARDADIALVQKYLSDNQRAVSWHEIQDCIEAIRATKSTTQESV